jgi:hypothetical protein
MKKFIFLALILVGCGARKVDNLKTVVNTAIIETAKTIDTTKTETNTKIIDCTATDEIVIEPIDNAKPILIEGKKYQNVRFTKRKIKNDILTTQNKKQSKGVIIEAKKEVKQQTEVKHKQIDKKASYWWLLWFLLLIPIYYFYKNYRVYFM